jgi:hypothetical protein
MKVTAKSLKAYISGTRVHYNNCYASPGSGFRDPTRSLFETRELDSLATDVIHKVEGG